jgi:hypothetical protein
VPNAIPVLGDDRLAIVDRQRALQAENAGTRAIYSGWRVELVPASVEELPADEDPHDQPQPASERGVWGRD